MSINKEPILTKILSDIFTAVSIAFILWLSNTIYITSKLNEINTVINDIFSIQVSNKKELVKSYEKLLSSFGDVSKSLSKILKDNDVTEAYAYNILHTAIDNSLSEFDYAKTIVSIFDQHKKSFCNSYANYLTKITELELYGPQGSSSIRPEERHSLAEIQANLAGEFIKCKEDYIHILQSLK